MWWCCCPGEESCIIASPPTTTLSGVINVSDQSHPDASDFGWLSKGRLSGTFSVTSSSSTVDIVFQYADASNYKYIRIQSTGGGTSWSATLIVRAAGSETTLSSHTVSRIGSGAASFCVSWQDNDVVLTIGDASTSGVAPAVQYVTSAIANVGKVGYRVGSGGSVTLLEFARHKTEVVESVNCPACPGDGECAGCCLDFADSYSVDLSAFALTNQNFTGCVDIDGVYVIDSFTGCEGNLEMTGGWEYDEPGPNCTSLDLGIFRCFIPRLRIEMSITRNELGFCKIRVDIRRTHPLTGAGPCENCVNFLIARYEKQSETLGDICDVVTLDYVTKDPDICAGSPPATITVTAL